MCFGGGGGAKAVVNSNRLYLTQRVCWEVGGRDWAGQAGRQADQQVDRQRGAGV